MNEHKNMAAVSPAKWALFLPLRDLLSDLEICGGFLTLPQNTVEVLFTDLCDPCGYVWICTYDHRNCTGQKDREKCTVCIQHAA